MRSCSEQTCHGTCEVLNATIDQKRLSGNAVRSVHNRIASASIRNITRPRNASMDVIRVEVGELTAGPCVTAGAGADTVRCITAAFYCRTRARARKYAARLSYRLTALSASISC